MLVSGITAENFESRWTEALNRAFANGFLPEDEREKLANVLRDMVSGLKRARDGDLTNPMVAFLDASKEGWGGMNEVHKRVFGRHFIEGDPR